MRFTRSAISVGVALSAALAMAAPASAAGTFTLTPSNFDPNGDIAALTTNIEATGFTGNATLFIDQCRVNDSGVFNFISDCNQSTGLTDVTSPSGAASDPFTVFSGDDPNGNPWGCGPKTSAGYTKYNTCYIRLVAGNQQDTANDVFLPITYTAGPVVTTTTTPATTTTVPGATTTTTGATTTTIGGATTTTNVPNPDVPEAPMTVLLPVGAAVLLGGSIVVARRRSSKSAA